MARRLKNIKTKEISLTKGDEKNSGAANDDARILFRKSNPDTNLTETDMSDDNNDHIDNDEGHDEQFAEGVIEHFNGLNDDEKAEFIVDAVAGAIEGEDAQEALGEITKAAQRVADEHRALQGRHEELKKSATAAVTLIEKMKTAGHVTAEEGGLVADIRKSLAPGQELSPEAVERIERIEKAQAETNRKEAISKAKTYGFGKAEDVADLETRIRKSLGTADADAFVALVKQAGALAKSSPLFKAVGEDAGNADATTPIAKCNAALSEIKKANPGFTDAQAKAHYWATNPEDYAAYQAERATAA